MERYRPSNGSEGEWFMEHFCYQCSVYGICKIWPKTMALGVDDPRYPSQWIQDDDGATCTSFTTERGGRKPYHCNKTAELPL